MELKNKKVNHAFYGEGTITNVSDGYLTVKYSNREGKYQFPQAFLGGHLALIPKEENSLLLEVLKSQNLIRKLENKPKEENCESNHEKAVEEAPKMQKMLKIASDDAILAAIPQSKYAKRTIHAEKNADFLNMEFGTNYKQWYKSGWLYRPDVLVWMIKIDGSINSDWINIWGDRETTTIIEKYVGNDKSSIDVAVKEQYRIVAEKDFSSPVHKYYVRGLFKYDKENSTPFKHIWRKIAD